MSHFSSFLEIYLKFWCLHMAVVVLCFLPHACCTTLFFSFLASSPLMTWLFLADYTVVLQMKQTLISSITILGLCIISSTVFHLVAYKLRASELWQNDCLVAVTVSCETGPDWFVVLGTFLNTFSVNSVFWYFHCISITSRAIASTLQSEEMWKFTVWDDYTVYTEAWVLWNHKNACQGLLRAAGSDAHTNTRIHTHINISAYTILLFSYFIRASLTL